MVVVVAVVVVVVVATLASASTLSGSVVRTLMGGEGIPKMFCLVFQGETVQKHPLDILTLKQRYNLLIHSGAITLQSSAVP